MIPPYFIPLAVIALLIVYVILINNSIVKKQIAVDEQRSSINIQLRKKIDLIPNLIKSVREYAVHEKTLFEKITKLRENIKTEINEDTISNNLMKKEKELNKELDTFNLKMENYPNLKSSENYIKLQEQLHKIENDISAARRLYNMAVSEYNKDIEIFPNSFIAFLRVDKKEEFYKTDGDIEQQSKNIRL